MERRLTLIHLCYHRIQCIQSGMLSYLHPTKQVLFSCQFLFHLFIQPIINLVMIIVLSLLSTLIFSIINAVILFVFLDSTLKNFLELTLFLDVTVRIMIFAIVLTLLALLFVIVTKKSMTALIADVILLVISLSGILRGISSKIENLLPLIGAKSFAFGRIEGSQMSQLYGFTLLVVEGILFLVFIMVVEMIRMRRKNGKNIF